MHLVYVDESGDDGFAKSGIYTKSITPSPFFTRTLRDNIGETIPLAVISVEGRGGFTDESTTVQERAGGNGGSP